jgi:hypothetical protein
MLIDRFLTQKTINKIAEWARKTAFTLLVVNTTSFIFSAPILLWWGIPISTLSIIGNIFFGPFLALFIILSSIFTIASIAGLSTTLPAYFLNKLTEYWMIILGFGSKKILCAQICTPAILLLMIAIVVCCGYLLSRSKTEQTILKILLSGSFFIALLFAIPLSNNQSIMESRSGKLTITNGRNGLELLDDGYLRKLTNPSKNIPFNLKMPIVKNHGTIKIHSLETTKASLRTFLALKELIICMDTQKIILPKINPPQKASFWRALYNLRHYAKINNVKIIQRPILRSTKENRSKISSR